MIAWVHRGLAASLTLAAVLGLLRPAHAYDMRATNWCDRANLLVNVNLNSFLARGFTAGSEIDQQIRTAATWWSDAQAGLRFSYGSLTSATGEGDPGPVSAACCINGGPCEDSTLDDNPGWVAYASYSYDFWTSCDLFTGATDGWKIVVRANLGSSCGDVSGWGLDVGDVRDGRVPLFVVLTHEFGHVLGFDHDCGEDQIMCSAVTNRRLITRDDVAGLRAIEGIDTRQLQTVNGVRSAGTISFGTVQNVGSHVVVWKPAISGNPGGSPAWDYAIGWQRPVGPTGPFGNLGRAEITVAVGNDDASNSFLLVTVRNTGRYSNNAIGLSVGWDNAIGVGYIPDDDANRRLHFIVSTNGGRTWTETVLAYSAMGGVSVSYDWWAHRWVMAWVGQGCANLLEQGCVDPLRQRVFTVMSTDWRGTSWTQPAVHYLDAITSPNLAPALTCARGDVNRCLMIYRTYESPALRRISQQAFQATASEDFLDTLPTTVETGNYGYSDLSLARVSGGYVMAYVWPTMANDKLTYRLKSDAADETGPWDYPTQTWIGASSRSGFSVAHNYRTGRIRFLWHRN